MRGSWLKELSNSAYLKEAHRQYQRCTDQGISLVSYRAAEFPQPLLHCPDAPLLLFCKGLPKWNDRPALAVVGTRRPTHIGRDFCERLIRELTPYNPTIISGFAYGIDICAHLSALEHGLHTIACMAHGLDLVYPRRHARHLQTLFENGSMVTECWLGTQPRPGMFLRRNRLIAGMSAATVVVESAERGGSLVTADLAFGYDREVFAVPGRPGDPMSSGCNQLIRQQKAQLLSSGTELAEAMNWKPVLPVQEPKGIGIPDQWPKNEKTLYGFLMEKGELHLDDIALGCGMGVPETLTGLFQLEMKGCIRSMPGCRYALKH